MAVTQRAIPKAKPKKKAPPKRPRAKATPLPKRADPFAGVGELSRQDKNRRSIFRGR